ncbi:hypothetical protein OL229_00730 [Neisseriaceae bacterium JH1-16]|nr:hypothetical protein [Neisseriaceae bacterium JH1-16]
MSIAGLSSLSSLTSSYPSTGSASSSSSTTTNSTSSGSTADGIDNSLSGEAAVAQNLALLATSFASSAGIIDGLTGGSSSNSSVTNVLDSLISAVQQNQTYAQIAANNASGGTANASSDGSTVDPSSADPGSTDASSTDLSSIIADDGTDSLIDSLDGTSGSSTSGVYDASGALQSTAGYDYVSGDANANWAQIVQNDPSMASEATGFELLQNVVNTLA